MEEDEEDKGGGGGENQGKLYSSISSIISHY